jgi:hypothetical protein
LFET